MFRTTLTAGALGAALSVGGLLAASTAATAAPITIGSQNFNDVDTASSTTVDYGGSGIPTDPVAWSSFTDNDGNELILGLGTHGRFANPNVTTSTDNVYGAVAGFNDGTPGSTSGLNGTTWNFNWFVEVIPATGSSAAIEDFGVELLYDLDPGAGTDEADHGVIRLSDALAAGDPTALVNQSSQNADFGFLQPGSTAPFVFAPSVGFDPFAAGEYTFALRSNQGNVGIAMNVAPIPLPAAGWLLLSAFGGLGLMARRRRKAA